MVDLIIVEFTKLKRSKLFLISLLGAMTAPLMEYIGLLKKRFDEPGFVITYKDYFDETHLYVLLIFGLIVYGVIASYLFSREYTENTLKTILTIPVSKVQFIISKYLMFYLWIILLTFVTWLTIILVGFISFAQGFSYELLMHSLFDYLLGGTLAFFTLTPFVFITLWMKNIVPTIITLAAVVMVNAALSNESLAVFFPWSASYLIVSKQVENYGYPVYVSYLVIGFVALIGFLSSILYFKKTDVK